MTQCDFRVIVTKMLSYIPEWIQNYLNVWTNKDIKF
jgi:hypothetical protein